MINDIHDDALANWHTLKRVEKSGPVGVKPRASRLPDENLTTASHGPQANLDYYS